MCANAQSGISLGINAPSERSGGALSSLTYASASFFFFFT
jgi:hypothetical protein